MGDNLNRHAFLRVVRANTPEQLSNVIRQVKAYIEILDFGQDSRGAYAYYRAASKQQMMAAEKQIARAKGGSAAGTVRARPTEG